jgi:uncharacterized UPF0160 family protein
MCVTAEGAITMAQFQGPLVVVHNGPAHADDVLAVAAWASGVVGNPRSGIHRCPAKVLRTRDQGVIDALRGRMGVTILDVGGKYDATSRSFGHHIKPVPARPDGLPYSSLGLLLLADCGETAADHPLVRHVDALDNGRQAPAPAWWPRYSEDPNGGSIAWVIHQANPVHVDGSPVEDREFDIRFGQMVELFMPLFGWDGSVIGEIMSPEVDRQLRAWHTEAAIASVASAARVKRIVSGGGVGPVLVLDQYEPKALDYLAQYAPGVLYCVYPGPGGKQWMVQQVPKELGSFVGRKPLPAAWAGLRDVAFQAATGVSDGVFCHPGRFIAGALSKVGATRLADKAVAEAAT